MRKRVRAFVGRIAAYGTVSVSDGAGFRLALGSTAVFMLAAHAFSFFNFTPQHDALIESFWQSMDHVVGLGRFLLPVYMQLRGYAPMPWVAGMLSIIFIGCSVYFITRTLRMDTRAEILLTSGFLSANICVLTLNSLFQFCIDAYMCSLLLACLGVWMLCRTTDLPRFAGAVACFLLSVGIYAAFITVALCLMMAVFLSDVADHNGFSPALWKKVGVWALALALAAGLFFVGCKLSLSWLGVAASTRKTSVFSLGTVSAGDLAYRIGVNYYFFLAMQFLGFSPVHHADYLGALYGLAGSLLAILCVVSFCRRNRGKLHGWIFALYAAAAFLFPLIARLVPIMTGNGGSNQTMFAQYLVFPLLLWLYFFRKEGEPEEGPRTGSSRSAAVVLLSALIILGNVRFANEAYTLQKVIYDRALYHTGQVIEDMQDAGYDAGKGDKVVVSGSFSLGGDLKPRLKKFSDAGIDGFYDTSITYSDTFRFMARMLGFGFRTVEGTPAQREQLSGMPAYPEEGYLREEDGVYLIRLG